MTPRYSKEFDLLDRLRATMHSTLSADYASSLSSQLTSPRALDIMAILERDGTVDPMLRADILAYFGPPTRG